jgi:hypothetical protein
VDEKEREMLVRKFWGVMRNENGEDMLSWHPLHGADLVVPAARISECRDCRKMGKMHT